MARHRARRVDGSSPGSRRRWLVTGLAGALLGGRLGFGCADGPLALLTAIAGAAAGTNLMLLATSSRLPAATRTAA